MPTLHALSLALVSCFIFSICFAAKNSVTARIQRKDGRFFVHAKDAKGFTREYAVSNAKDVVFDLLRQETKQVTVKGEFVDNGNRTGTVKVSEVGEEVADPLGLGQPAQ